MKNLLSWSCIWENNLPFHLNTLKTLASHKTINIYKLWSVNLWDLWVALGVSLAMARSRRLSIYFLVITGLFTFIMDYYIYYRYVDNPYTWIIYIIVGLYTFLLKINHIIFETTYLQTSLFWLCFSVNFNYNLGPLKWFCFYEV